MDKHKKLFLLFILTVSGGILILLFQLKDISIVREQFPEIKKPSLYIKYYKVCVVHPNKDGFSRVSDYLAPELRRYGLWW